MPPNGFSVNYLKVFSGKPRDTDRLAQLVEHRTAVREVAGSKSRPDQHLGSLNNWGESVAFVTSSANG